MVKLKNNGEEPLADEQEYKVGPGKPPKEHQFKPGQTGNPNGPPVRRTQLWVYLCKYMEMTDAEIDKLDKDGLTQSQQTALKMVEDAKNGKCSGADRLARYIIDRDEGKAVQTQVVDDKRGKRPTTREELEKALRRLDEISKRAEQAQKQVNQRVAMNG